MSIGLIVVLILFSIGAFVAVAVLLDLPIVGGSRSGVKGNIKSIVASQRAGGDTQGNRVTNRKGESIFESAEQSSVRRVSNSNLTLEKRLKYARLNIPPLVFRISEVAISLIAFSITSVKFNAVIQVASLLAGPLFMRWLLNTMVDRRFKAFDADYPAFLSSVVGLLKTGMNPIAALEAAAQGLEEGSLVKLEVELMIERLRFGVSEDRSIGSFGEDVFHPEIELFVQALLLSRRVGGTLSDTLERLSKQVRKRQYFRNSANAAVSMQRGSIWFIIMILVLLEVYLSIVFPESVWGTIADPVGWQIWQGCVLLILLGIFWVRQVTKIKI
ncbi:MAG: type II secretion system F family protein [Bdellovibrionota bacterium]|nr:MAG: type II secretion system F family protein [Bdellovibrionota bacterium]